MEGTAAPGKAHSFEGMGEEEKIKVKLLSVSWLGEEVLLKHTTSVYSLHSSRKQKAQMDANTWRTASLVPEHTTFSLVVFQLLWQQEGFMPHVELITVSHLLAQLQSDFLPFIYKYPHHLQLENLTTKETLSCVDSLVSPTQTPLVNTKGTHATSLKRDSITCDINHTKTFPE